MVREVNIFVVTICQCYLVVVGRPLCLLCSGASQEITHAALLLSRSGELHVKAGYVSTLLAGSPVNRGTLPAYKQALSLNYLKEMQLLSCSLFVEGVRRTCTLNINQPCEAVGDT